MDIVNIILPIVYIVVGCALIWFIVELALTIKRVRTTVVELKTDIDPAIADVKCILQEAKPVVEKIDPLVDRVTLTVDSANLEIMRLDDIMEDVSKITGGVSKAVGAVDTVTAAPLDLVNSVTRKIKNKFKPKYASDESVELGEEKSTDKKPVNPIVDFVDTASSAAGEAIKEQVDARAKRREQAEEQTQIDKEKAEKMDTSSQKLTESVLDYVDIDTIKL